MRYYKQEISIFYMTPYFRDIDLRLNIINNHFSENIIQIIIKKTSLISNMVLNVKLIN